MPLIDSQVRFGQELSLPDPDVKNEPMLFNCNMLGAALRGGPITQAFLQALPDNWLGVPLVIDTRVHMLMPGWYPCVPGWHHDDVPRTRQDKQPNYAEGQDRSEHCILLINAGIAPTEFATGESRFSELAEGEVAYAKWHEEVEADLLFGRLQRQSVPDRTLTFFTDRTWHRGVQAVEGGWRWFGRASRYYDAQGNVIPRRNPRTNEVRRQVQVYLPAVNAGW